MKTNFFKVAFISLIICATVYGLQLVSSNEEAEKLVLTNIEALAGDESGSAWGCMGNGSLYCHGYNVKYSFSGFSLGDFE